VRRLLVSVAVVLSSLTVAMAGHADEAEARHPCWRWRTTALEFFTRDQWSYPVRGIMYRESRCDPNAYNPSGARGLMQIMPFWADDCGGWPNRLFRPRFNLRCARHVYEVQGWHAWSVYPF
jgi:Transglycosylase SLT domain